jgi:hypothetical protein
MQRIQVPRFASVLLVALACLPGIGSALEEPILTHTAVRCSVDETGQPELQVRRVSLIVSV